MSFKKYWRDIAESAPVLIKVLELEKVIKFLLHQAQYSIVEPHNGCDLDRGLLLRIGEGNEQPNHRLVVFTSPLLKAWSSECQLEINHNTSLG
jgi:hypothetical protein